MSSQLLIRLDDACPWHHRQRWQKIEDILHAHALIPLVAVIPDCRDPDLQLFERDGDFWSRVQAWQAKGWIFALHGCTHVFESRKPGLVPLNRYSEFAGVPESIQRQKIQNGMKLLNEQNIVARAWVAPAHSFDKTTLRALLQETAIRVVSDGLSTRLFRRFGFLWVPQQLWRPRLPGKGLWTLCLHPNEMTDADFSKLDLFLSGRPQSSFASWSELIAASEDMGTERETKRIPVWGIYDFLFGISFRCLRVVKRIVQTVKGKK